MILPKHLKDQIKKLHNERIIKIIAYSTINPFWQLELLDALRCYFPDMLEGDNNLYQQIINCIPLEDKVDEDELNELDVED